MTYQSLLRKGRMLSAFWVLLMVLGCSSTSLESYNRSMYQFNKSVDTVTLKPLAKAYRYITPDVVEDRVKNFFANLSEVSTFINSLLQGKLHNAAVSSARLVWNTTLGIGGLFDVATAMNIKANKEDFGQTLQVWGLPSGPYLVLPFLGPSTLTDSLGLLGDMYTSPIYHYEDWPSKNVKNGVILLGIVNKRAGFLTVGKMLGSAALDEYSFVKNIYLQSRKALVNDGEVHDKAVDKDLDDLFSN